MCFGYEKRKKSKRKDEEIFFSYHRRSSSFFSFNHRRERLHSSSYFHKRWLIIIKIPDNIWHCRHLVASFEKDNMATIEVMSPQKNIQLNKIDKLSKKSTSAKSTTPTSITYKSHFLISILSSYFPLAKFTQQFCREMFHHRTTTSQPPTTMNNDRSTLFLRLTHRTFVNYF